MKKTLVFAVTLLLCTNLFAQKGNIGFVYPAGAQRGTTFTLTVGGQNLSSATGILISGDGISTELIPTTKAAAKKKKGKKKKDIGEEDNLQLADQVRFRVTIAPDAELGMRDVRLVLPGGMTNRLYFEVGEIPDVLEDGKAALSATSETLPVCFNGQIMRSDVDRFTFRAERGEQLVIKVKGREFVPYMADAVPGWFQPIIRLYGPDGREVAYNDDYTFHVDPVLFYKVPVSGEYAVEINDALYRGREDFVYRIEVGELPFITGISPMGCKKGAKCTVRLRGYNLKNNTLTVKPTKTGRITLSAKSKSGLTSNPVLFEVTDLEPLAEGRKMNTTVENAWKLEMGQVCEQSFTAPLQQHWYSIEVEDKQPVLLSIAARRLGAPTDARITVFDVRGRKVEELDDVEDTDESMMTHFADPQLVAKLNPGAYFVRVIESQGCCGVDYSYRLSYQLSSPDFSLQIVPATFAVPAGGTGVFTVNLTRKQKFNGPVHLIVDDLPKGFKVAGTEISKTGKKALVSITAPEDARQGVIHPSVKGVGTPKKGDQITRKAVPTEEMMQAFYYTHLMPIGEFRMEVGPQLPFTMSVVKEGPMRLTRDRNLKVRVKIVRKEGFSAPVTIMAKTTGSSVKAEAVVIPEGSNEAEIEFYIKKKEVIKRNYLAGISLSGVVKGTSKKIAGKGRNAFVASVTAHAPTFEIEVLADRLATE